MKLKILIRAEAESDLVDAFARYENQSVGLGNDFLLCVEAALSQIQRNPESSQIVHRKVRRMLLRRFPYGVFYTLSNENITVIAVFHAKREPKRWQRRS